jgi:hypothetical protein
LRIFGNGKKGNIKGNIVFVKGVSAGDLCARRDAQIELFKSKKQLVFFDRRSAELGLSRSDLGRNGPASARQAAWHAQEPVLRWGNRSFSAAQGVSAGDLCARRDAQIELFKCVKK